MMSVVFSGIRLWLDTLPPQTKYAIKSRIAIELGASVTGVELLGMFSRYERGDATDFDVLLVAFMSREVLGFVGNVVLPDEVIP